jgi:hypothetical protein
MEDRLVVATTRHIKDSIKSLQQRYRCVSRARQPCAGLQLAPPQHALPHRKSREQHCLVNVLMRLILRALRHILTTIIGVPHKKLNSLLGAPTLRDVAVCLKRI